MIQLSIELFPGAVHGKEKCSKNREGDCGEDERFDRRVGKMRALRVLAGGNTRKRYVVRAAGAEGDEAKHVVTEHVRNQESEEIENDHLYDSDDDRIGGEEFQGHIQGQDLGKGPKPEDGEEDADKHVDELPHELRDHASLLDESEDKGDQDRRGEEADRN